MIKNIKTVRKAVYAGWSIKIWPTYNGYTVDAVKAGEDERIGRGSTVKNAVKAAFRGYRGSH